MEIIEISETEIIIVAVREETLETETITVAVREETSETEITIVAVREDLSETETITVAVREDLSEIKMEETAEITEITGDRTAAREEMAADVVWLSQRSQANQ